MVWNEELEKEIPEGWNLEALDGYIEFKNGKSKPKRIGKYPLYGGNGIIDYVNKYNAKNVVIIGRVGAHCGSLFIEKNDCWVSDNAIAAESKNNHTMFIYYLLKSLKINARSEGTGQPLITQKLLKSIKTIKPKFSTIDKFETKASMINKYKNALKNENKHLFQLKSLLLGRMTREDKLEFKNELA